MPPRATGLERETVSADPGTRAEAASPGRGEAASVMCVREHVMCVREQPPEGARAPSPGVRA